MRLLSVVVALALAPLADALAAPVLRAVSSVTSPLAPLFDSIARQQAGTYDVPAVRAAIHRERQSAPGPGLRDCGRGDSEKKNDNAQKNQKS